MNSASCFRLIPGLSGLTFAALVGFLGIETASALEVPTGPIGDLTVTVRERPDGGVNFSLGGSTEYNDTSSFSSTPTGFSKTKGPIPAASPSAPEYQEIDLPAGLQFLVEGSPVLVTRLIFSSGFWYLYVNSSNTYATSGATIAGSGSIALPGVPYSHFEPGSESVFGFGNLFDITYEVLPYVAPPAAPRLRAPGARRFPATAVGRSSRRVSIRVANVGDAPATGIRVAIRGGGARQFQASQPRSRSLAPGQSTSYSVVYRPRGAGRHRAAAEVSSNAPTVSTQLAGVARRASTGSHLLKTPRSSNR